METDMNNIAQSGRSGGARFYTVKDIMEMTTWSKTTGCSLNVINRTYCGKHGRSGTYPEIQC